MMEDRTATAQSAANSMKETCARSAEASGADGQRSWVEVEHHESLLSLALKTDANAGTRESRS